MLVKDISKIILDPNKHFGITSLDNIHEDAKKHYQRHFTFSAEMLYNALSAMKAMNGNLDFDIMLPKDPYPIILNNGIQCYLVAPITDTGDY